MSFIGNFFGGKSGTDGEPAMPDRAGMLEMMKNPAMRKLAAEIQGRLSREEQQELMRLVTARDTIKLQAFMKEHLPGFEENLKDSGILGG